MSATQVAPETQNALGPAADFFIHLSDLLNDSLVENVAKHYQTVANALYAPVLGAVTLMFIVLGIRVWFYSANTSDVLKVMARVVFCTALGFSWSYVYQYIANPILNGIPELIGQMFGSNSDNLILGLVANIFNQIKQTVDSLMSDAGMNVGAVIFAGLIAIADFAAVAFMLVDYFFIVISSKLIIAMMLVLTPLFLAFFMFESTRNYFFNWVNFIMQPILTLIILNLIVVFMGSLVTTTLNHYYENGLSVNLTAAFIGFLVPVFIILLMQKASSIASNLVSNGFSISGGIAEDAQSNTGGTVKGVGGFLKNKTTGYLDRRAANKSKLEEAEVK